MSDGTKKMANHEDFDGRPLERVRAALEQVMLGGPRLSVAEWYAENGLAFDAIEELERKGRT